jgi:hypothetical protein
MSRLSSVSLLLLPFLAILLIFGCGDAGEKQADGTVSEIPEAPPLNRKILSFEGDSILLGPANRVALMAKPCVNWFVPAYMEYEVDSVRLSPLLGALDDLEIMMFMGSWCEDSQREVPRFYKILDYLGFPESRINLVALNNDPDHYKQSPSHEEEGHDIEKVPTMIFFRFGDELGRIVESPEVSLEADMIRILNGTG